MRYAICNTTAYCLLGDRQAEGKGAALARPAVDPQAATVGFDQVACQVGAERSVWHVVPSNRWQAGVSRAPAAEQQIEPGAEQQCRPDDATEPAGAEAATRVWATAQPRPALSSRTSCPAAAVA